jgi:tetratricopeptide (TPR) repeat protein
MIQADSCTVCGRSLPGDAPLGLCPACLFIAALAAESSVSELGEAPSGGPGLDDLPVPDSDGDPALTETQTTDGPFPEPGRSAPEGPSDFPQIPGYEIRGVLGKGGMGVVYEALQCRANRVVALKTIRGEADLRPDQLERFRFEVQAAARLRHPNIVRVYEVGEVDGRPYFSLELLAGGSLKARLADAPMAPRPAAELLAALALAVDAAHAAGIVHRDLKPSNVLFDTEGTPNVTDFGLAKRLESEEGQTLTGQVMGTPCYMAPEQARGDNRAVGPAADIYSLGAILYEMLTGRPPFKGATSSETIYLVISQDPPAPSRLQPRVPRDLETICLKCLRKEPWRRYETARMLADDLRRFLAGQPVRARRTPAWERGVKWARRRPLTAALSAAGLAAAVGLAVAAVWVARNDEALSRSVVENLCKSAGLRARGELDEARLTLTKLETQLQFLKRPWLAGLLRRVRGELNDVDRLRADRAAREGARARADRDLSRFRALRDEALFHDAGVDAFWRDPVSGEAVRGPSRLLRTRDTARPALEIVTGGTGDLRQLMPHLAALPEGERSEVRSDCYLLLLVLSAAVADPLPGEDSRGQAGEALRLLDRAAPIRAPTVAYHLRRASCLDRLGDADAARLERGRAGRLTPAGAFDHILLGQDCSRRGHWDEARAHFRAALRERPELFLAHYLLATAALSSNPPRAAEACSELTYCLTRNPSYAWLYQLRGLAYGQMGAADAALAAARGHEGAAAPSAEAEARYQDAEDDFRKATDLGLDRDLRYTLLMNRGTMRFQRQRFRDAATDFEQAVALDDGRFNGYASLAQALRQLGRHGEAVEQFGKAIERAPGLSALYRGRALARAGRDDLASADARAAIRDLEESARREPAGSRDAAADLARAARLLLRLDRSPDRLAAALRAAERALEIAPDLLDAHLVRVAVLLDQGRYDKVIESCEAALAQAAPAPALYLYRGLGRAGRRDFPGAIDDYTRALTLRPEWDEALGQRGWAYLLSESFGLALHDFDKLIGLAPGSPEGYAGRGLARVRRGLIREGLADAEEALRRSAGSQRMLYIASKTYAHASGSAATEAARRGRPASRDSLALEARAAGLLREALERTPPGERSGFWREVVAHDLSMKPLLHNPQIVKRLQQIVPSAR